MQAPRASHAGIYAFDAADPELSLLPMAARRALDVAGVHLSLAAWQTLALPARQLLVQLGAGESVATERVRACLREVSLREEAVRPDPDPNRPPPELITALGPLRPMAAERWSQLHALDRYVLAQLARRSRLERLAVAYDEIVAVRDA